MTTEHANPATMVARPRLYFACPHCGNDEMHSVTHFLSDQRDIAFGPWQCDGCGWVVEGRWHAATQTVSITKLIEQKPPIKGFMLLRIAPSKVETPLFFVVEHEVSTRHGFDGWEAWAESTRYWVEENTCPVNLVRVEAIIEGKNQDPHGVLQFVSFAPRPADWDAHNADWSVLFPQIAGPEIDGTAVAAPVVIEAQRRLVEVVAGGH
ncbi:MAG: hypothetical protein ACRYHQ_24445 [Janthinobacterium lividum]